MKKLKAKILKHSNKVIALGMALVLTVISLAGLTFSSVAAFPSDKTGKTAKVAITHITYSGYLSTLGTKTMERITLSNSGGERAAFCMSPGSPLRTGSTYKSSNLNAGYARKYYSAALAYYYKDRHAKGSDRYTYRAVTQMFVWRIAQYKKTTDEDFTAKNLNTASFKNCVINTLNTMKSAGSITMSKSADKYYSEAVDTIFKEGEKKTYNNEVTYVKWSDANGSGQILLTGKYSPVEDVMVNLEINKKAVKENGTSEIGNANLAGITYYVYDNLGCTKRTKDKDGNNLVIKLNKNGHGVSSYMAMEPGEEKNIYVMEHSSVEGTFKNDDVIKQTIETKISEDGTKKTFTLPNGKGGTVDEVWHNNFQLTKVGNDGKKIPGAVFDIYEWNGSKYAYADSMTTGNDGVATSKQYYYTKKNVGKFMIKEKSVPKPYVNEKWSQTVKLNNKKNTFKYTVENVIDNQGDVTVKKSDEDTGEPLDGCIFALYKYEKGDWKYYKNLENKGNGIYRLTGLPNGSYALTELNTADGYIYPAYSDNGGTLRTADDWEKFLVGVDAGGQLKPTYHYVFKRTNKKIPVEITVTKKDKDTGENLSDFEFGLYEKTGEDYILTDIQSTEANGQCTFSNIDITKTYKVKELSAKEGYTIGKNNEKVIDMMKESNADTTQVQLTDPFGNKTKDMLIPRYMAVVNGHSNVEVTFENEKVKRPIRIHKISSSRTGKPSVSLANATFNVYDMSKLSESDAMDYLNFDYTKYEPVDTVTTAGDGYATTKALPFGKYIVVEAVVPKNMLKADNQIVEIDPNISSSDDDNNLPEADAGLESDDGKYVNVEIVDAEFESRLKVVKKDAQTDKTIKIKGAGFKVYDKDNNKYITQTVYEKEKVKEPSDDAKGEYVEVDKIVNSYDTDIFYTDDNGELKLPNVLACGNYELVEVKAPDKYALSNERVPFTIDATMDYETDEEFQDPIITINFKDDPISGEIIINKKGETPKAFTDDGFTYEKTTLAGVTFKLTAKEDIKASYDNDIILYHKGDIVRDNLTTDANGQIKISGLPLGQYEVTETKASAGYIIDKTVNEVSLESDGNENVTKTVNVENKRQKISIKVYKKDKDNNKLLSGAVFGIYAKEDIKDKEDNVIVKRDTLLEKVITNDEGYAVIEKKDYPVSEYYIKEITPPKGYATTKDTIEVSSLNAPDTDTYINKEYTMYDDITKFDVSKLDITNKEELPGATLEIWYMDDNNKKVSVDSWVSTNEAHRIQGLEVGREYTLTEKVAPAGYVTAESVKFTVNDTGEVQSVKMEDDVTKVQITKSDISTTKPVVGATLVILDKNNKEVVRFVTTDKPYYIEKLPVGEYTLREMQAPTDKGYVTAEDVKFTVSDTGNIQKVNMDDDYTKVQISKTDITGAKLLPGAKLKITDENGKEIYSWTTEDTVTQIDRLPIGKYTLTEVSAPLGYTVSESIDFTVKDSGEIVKVTMKDELIKGQISLTKKDEKTKEPLEGAEFGVYDKNNNLVDTMITNKDGKAMSKLLTLNKREATTYTVSENKAPNGYEKTDATFEAKFNKSEDNKAVVSVDLGVITNKAQSGIFVKTGVVANILPIVIFTIAGILVVVFYINDYRKKRQLRKGN